MYSGLNIQSYIKVMPSVLICNLRMLGGSVTDAQKTFASKCIGPIFNSSNVSMLLYGI